MRRYVLLIIAAMSGLVSFGQGGSHQRRIEKIRPLRVLCGDWTLNSTMLPLGRPRVTEMGTMKCSSIYDSTYIECEVALKNSRGTTRSYRQFITYNTDSSRYEVLYLYSGTPMRVLEFGQFDAGALKTNAVLSLGRGNAETIDVLFRINNINELYLESRSSATRGDVDYVCKYERVR